MNAEEAHTVYGWEDVTIQRLRNARMADWLCARLQSGIGGFDFLSWLLRF